MAEKNELRELSKMSPKEIDQLRMMRWKSRTDLKFLCNNILNYPDVHDPVHTPVLNILQKFPAPDRNQYFENDKIVNGQWVYVPLQRHTSLPGFRRRLILDPRGWLKTTINAQAHSIQWILNYPDIAMMIVQSNLEKAEMILSAIKKHFQYNPIFRMLFPEHCPMGSSKIDDFGTKGKFTTKARGRSITRGEETFTASSIDAGTAGIHVDVMKFSDIVEPSNVGTKEQMQSVTKSFNMAENLLVGPNYWIDVEGTRYAFGDTYGHIIELNRETPPEKRIWQIHARGCYKKKMPQGKIQVFSPDELELPNEENEAGEFIPHWIDADRGFTYDQFESKRRADPYIFSAQQENSPKGGIDGREIFPVVALEDKIYPQTLISRKDFSRNVRVAYYIAAVDTAETKNERSNYSSIAIAAFASDGRVYVNEIIHGKFLPDELVKHICDLPRKDRNMLGSSDKKLPLYGDKLKVINIEETGFVRGLSVALRNYQQTTGAYLPLEMIKRDNQMSKIERIEKTLQPYYASGKLIFLDDIEPIQHLAEELRQFPMSATDDILDSLCDLFQNKEWFGREVPVLNYRQVKSFAIQRMLGTENPFDKDDYIINSDGSRDTIQDPYYSKTGGL